MKKKVLFIADGIALSHVIRMKYLGQSLSRDKYDIYFAAGKEFQNFVGEMDNLVPLDTLGVAEFDKRLNGMAFKEIYDMEIMDRYIKSDLELFDEINPDVVVGDMRISLGISTKLRKIPYINIQNAYWSIYSEIEDPAIPDIPIFHYLPHGISMGIVRFYYPRVERDFAYSYNLKSEELNIPKVKSLNEFYSTGDMNLYLDTPVLSPTKELPDTERYIGPVLDFPEVSLPDFWDRIPKDKPLVYCSIGSTGSVDKTTKLINALKDIDVSVILVTAGKNLPGGLPDNIFVCKYVPALKVIERASLVIFNGGSGTLYQAMSKGKPVIAIPSSMDQYFACDQVEKRGLGIVLDYKKLNSPKLKKWIKDLIDNPKWKNNCKKIEEEIKQYNSKDLFPKALDDFIGEINM